MNRRTFQYAVFTVAPLFVIACGRPPLELGELEPTPEPAAGVPATSLPAATAKLDGIWSGQLEVSAPGINWGPLDRLTLKFAADGTLAALQFQSNIPPPHTFGSGPMDLPLQGTRDAPLTPGSLYPVRVTVDTAEFGRDRFHLSYRVVGIGETPGTDYVVELRGQLDGDILDVQYAATGKLLIVTLGARGAGELRRGG